MATSRTKRWSRRSPFGIPRSEARRLITQYGVQRIKAAIAYTLNRTTKNAAPVDNVAAYFRKALTHGYAVRRAGNGSGGPGQESAQSKQEQIRDKYLAAKVEEAGAYFRELEIDDQTKLIERYNETVAGSKDLTLSPKKKASKLAQTSFFRWLALDTWGEPTSDDLLEFLLKSSLAGHEGLAAGCASRAGRRRPASRCTADARPSASRVTVAWRSPVRQRTRR